MPRQTGREEEGDRDHMRRVIVEVAIGVADVIDPIEVAKDAIGKSVAPGAQQHRPNDHQRDIGENGNTKGEGHMLPHAEFAADLDLAHHPADESECRADRDDSATGRLRPKVRRPGRLQERADRSKSAKDSTCRPERHRKISKSCRARRKRSS